MSELVPLWEIRGATYGGIEEAEMRERFTVVKNWRGEDSVSVEDAAKAYAIGRPRMKVLDGGARIVDADG